MKPIGIVLIIAGILMLVFTQFNFTTEKKVVDLGAVEINRQEEKTVQWPAWSGVIALVTGIVLFAAGRKRA